MSSGEGSFAVGPIFGALLAEVEAYALAGKSVLIHGPTGTGKELLLRAYRDRVRGSGRKAEILSCAELAPDLLESELFGHKKGAFTGATDDKVGLVEEYDCLGLDEIGESPAHVQACLLRTMETGEYRRLGSVEFRKRDVLFTAATNNPVALRRDLVWRFQRRIRVPGLWERREDLVELIAKIGREVGVSELTERCIAFLVAKYGWPGNVREVFFVMSEAASRCGGAAVDLIHLPMFGGASVGRPKSESKWSLHDPEFAGRALERFPSEFAKVPSVIFDRLRYQELTEPEPSMSDAEFRRVVCTQLASLAQAAENRLFENEIVSSPNSIAAAKLAQERWYRERSHLGLKGLAKIENRTPEAIRQRLRSLGLPVPGARGASSSA